MAGLSMATHTRRCGGTFEVDSTSPVDLFAVARPDQAHHNLFISPREYWSDLSHRRWSLLGTWLKDCNDRPVMLSNVRGDEDVQRNYKGGWRHIHLLEHLTMLPTGQLLLDHIASHSMSI
ncbi:hypothetical protein BP00DRAFT_5618 [Aspergillus indologenus CBS 114.80]|uniref:Uncharacterized protein n=1 Tax=Aspergillus indologenus CBS 114.80 TaxID=1450541 RepID=A0A2V5IND4_9EURO|nr:hypothetical protein BP00DRAFT_5618 [Aspergillus indologenus CBS 114.80]